MLVNSSAMIFFNYFHEGNLSYSLQSRNKPRGLTLTQLSTDGDNWVRVTKMWLGQALETLIIHCDVNKSEMYLERNHRRRVQLHILCHLPEWLCGCS